jgi:hypothetical protein
MDNGGNYSDDNDLMFNPHLPAVIPIPRVPVIVLLSRRFAVPFWGLILLATFGSVLVGALAATLWPWNYHNKASGMVAARPHGNDVANAGDVDDSTLTAAEVTKIDLSPATLNTSSLSPADLNTTNLNTTDLGHSRQIRIEPVTITPIQPAAAEPSTQTAHDACHAKPSGPQLVLNLQRTVLHSDEPAALGLTVDSAPDGAHLLICGFTAQSVFSVGHSLDEKTWTVPASMIADTTIMPPRGFVGPMDLAVMLVNTDRSLVDRKVVHLQWLPQAQPPAAPPRDFAKHDSLLSYGAHIKAIGNLADARQIFSRVAQAGDPRGAFMLAETYDPISLAKHQLLPKDSDLELARIWYRKASDLGSPDAPGRLDRLTNW